MTWLVEVQLSDGEQTLDFVKSLESFAHYTFTDKPPVLIPTEFPDRFIFAIEDSPDFAWLRANEPRFINAWPASEVSLSGLGLKTP